jgi:RNA polymerase sigma-70 factor (ECF subfamily)
MTAPLLPALLASGASPAVQSCRETDPDRPRPAAPALEATVDLLSRAQRGDEGAWEALVARHRRVLRRVAHGRLPSCARGMTDTEDVVQDAFMRAVTHLPRFEFRHQGSLLAYLRRIVINRIVDEVRRAARTPVATPLIDEHADHGRSPLDRAIGRERAARYRRALLRLRERDRRVIRLRLERGLAFGEIASELGMASGDAARVAAGRALVRLARFYTE